MPSLAPLRRILPYFVPYLKLVGSGLLLVVAAAGAAALVPWLLQAAIDALAAGAPRARILALTGQLVGAAVLSGALRFGMRELLNGVSRRIEYDLRNDLFEQLTTLDAAFFARTRTGDIMARLTNDLNAVRMAAGPAIMYFVNTIAGGVFALSFMLSIDWRLTALALLPMIVLPFLTIRLGRAIHFRFESVQEQFGTLTTQVQENLSGVRVVRAYRQEGAELDRFDSLNDEYLRRNLSLVRLNSGMHSSFGLIAGLGAVVVLGAGGMLALSGAISIGAFVAFGFYLGMLTWPLISLGWVINLFQRGAASLSRLATILDAEPSVRTAADPIHLPPTTGGRELEFKDVGFYYPPAAGQVPRWVLRHLSLTMPAGATVGIVGATGSGKSALLDLIPRFLDAQEGQILLDGVDIRRIPLGELRREVAMVPQESLLFSDTIGVNLEYGLPAVDGSGETGEEAGAGAGSAAALPDTVAWAAGIAQLAPTIAELPAGYDTILGERGVNLSGGQRQRTALARALARRAPLLLLDDTLSAVDTHTEAAILKGLREALAGRTALIASHRISTLRDADLVIVLDGGRIVEQGTHQQLVAARGRYWSLLRRQQLEAAIAEDGGTAAAVNGDNGIANGTGEGPKAPTLEGDTDDGALLAMEEQADTFGG